MTERHRSQGRGSLRAPRYAGSSSLVRLTVGGLPVHKRGEMLHSRLRYFDTEHLEPGLPQGVAALVTGMEEDSIEVDLVNTNLFERRRVIVQGGAYGEHEFTRVSYRAATEEQPPGSRQRNTPGTEERTTNVGASFFEVVLEPGAGTTLKIGMEWYVNEPSYRFPWQ